MIGAKLDGKYPNKPSEFYKKANLSQRNFGEVFLGFSIISSVFFKRLLQIILEES